MRCAKRRHVQARIGLRLHGPTDIGRCLQVPVEVSNRMFPEPRAEGSPEIGSVIRLTRFAHGSQQ